MTRVALLGFGTVGSAVARRLSHADRRFTRNVQLTHICDRRADEKRDRPGRAALRGPGPSPIWTTDFEEILRSDADVVVEAIGGVEPAAAWIRAALLAGKSVVTANKQVVARHGTALWRLAERQGRQFRFEAAVGGAMPIVRAIGDGLAGDRLTRLVAILNGTTNAVLSQMDDSGCSLDEALADAQRNGYAESNPATDLDGDDARAKLAILCALAFGVQVDAESIPARSAAGIAVRDFADARRRGGTIRQLARAEYDYARATLTASVGPEFVARDSIFARTHGPQNAALITGEHCGDIGIFGAGAGGDATAVAVVSDIAAIARDRAAIIPAPTLTSSFCLLPFNFSLCSSEAV